MRTEWALAVVLLVLSASVSAETNPRAPVTVEQAEFQNIANCVKEVRDDPAYATLLLSMPVDPRAATDKQLNDTSKATDEQVHAIFLTHPVQFACVNAGVNALARTNIQFAIQMAGFEGVNSFSMHQVALRKWTWGQFNQHRMRDNFLAEYYLEHPSEQLLKNTDEENRKQLEADEANNQMIETQFENTDIHPPANQ